ncbi:MAG: L-histidine N(alpha)-methyltransferase [Alphaproteobacteria bacterium]
MNQDTALRQDTIDWFSRKRGGHMQKYMFGTIPRPDGRTGASLWHEFLRVQKDYYIIEAEASMIPGLTRALGKNFDTIVEFGVGDEHSLRTKTLPIISSQPLLERYRGFDISSDQLAFAEEFLREHAPHVTMESIVGDFYGNPITPKGNHVLGLCLGSTISNLDIMAGEPFPAQTLVENVGTLLKASKGSEDGSLGFSFDASRDFNRTVQVYTHPVTQKFVTGVMYDIKSVLKPEGNYDPAKWQYHALVDEDNYVIQNGVVPLSNQNFSIGGHNFNFKPGDAPLIIVNAFKIPLDVMLGILDEAKVKCCSDPIRSNDHPMVMLEIA